MPNRIQLASERIKEEGLCQFLIRAWRFISDNPKFIAEPFYQILKPRWREFECGGARAEFSMEPAMLSMADFRDGFRSERHVLTSFLNELQPDDRIWDVGANVGIYSCLSSQVTPDGVVYSFEPHPVTAEILRDNHKQNNVRGEVIELALSDTEGQIDLAEYGKTAHNLITDFGRSVVQVQAMAGDTVIQEGTKSPTAMKIDVEGAELRVLKGMTRLFEEEPPRFIFLEEHGHLLSKLGGSSEEVRDILQESGYDIEVLGSRQGTVQIR